MRIGHASISENGTVDGKAGDQTGNEVCIRGWYAKGWTVLLRAKDPAIAEKMAQTCEAGCMNPAIGYSQPSRNSLHTAAKAVGYDLSKVTAPCGTDCSSFMVICAIAAGVTGLEYTGNAPTTRTMVAAFAKTGKFLSYTDSKHLSTPDYMKRGDILVKPGSHTVMVLDDGSKINEDLETVARDVIAGKYGNGDARKAYLLAAGYNPAAVQAEVNRLLK